MPSSPTPESSKLAFRLLVYERSQIELGNGGQSAAVRVCAKLQEPLCTLAGKAGYNALLSRAVSLARKDVEWIAGVRICGDGALEGLSKAAAGLPRNVIEDGEAAVVARLLDLLITFVGSALTARILDGIWAEGAIGK